MSFDIHLECFRNGEPEERPLAFFVQAFASFIKKTNHNAWNMSGSHAEIYFDSEDNDENSMTSGFMVAGPPGEHPFWDALIGIMKQTPSLLYWPSTIAAVADKAWIPHLPPRMINDIDIRVVSTPQEIWACIKEG